MFSTPFTSCSIGVATDCSTADGRGARVGRRHANRRRREERDTARCDSPVQREEPEQHDEDRDDDRDDRPPDEEVSHGLLPSYWLAAGSALRSPQARPASG